MQLYYFDKNVCFTGFGCSLPRVKNKQKNKINQEKSERNSFVVAGYHAH